MFEMLFLDDTTIKLDRELSELDIFTLDFIKILEKHVNYVVVSGYVSILLGRARGSEDIDIIIPNLDSQGFFLLCDDLKKSGFWCIQAEENGEIFDYFKDGIAVRFARKGAVIPNIELKRVKNRVDEEAMEKSVKVVLEGGEIHVSNLELQVAFKEEVLGSPKDVEDARHIRGIADERLSEDKIKGYKAMLNEFY